MAKKLVVCGGNGFLGSRICKVAVRRGWDVTSISRSGEPTWSAITSSPVAPAWSTSVHWKKADVLSPDTYKPMLAGADAVVHSMGILLEMDYKGLISGRESIWDRLRGKNPFQEQEGQSEQKSSGGGLTYEVMNRDSAITLAREASAQSVPSFVYISAAAGAPILPTRYITSKRDAESTISSSLPKLRSIFIRPGFLYDSSRSFTLPMAFFGSAGSMVNSMVGGRLSWLAGAAVEKPLKADLVAEAVVEAIEDRSVKGVADTAKIEALATNAWRKDML